MMFQYYFKRMGSSETLKDLSQRKLSDVMERFVGGTAVVRLTFLTERSEQKIQCILQGPNGQTIHASASSDSMYSSLDAVAHKIEAQLSRLKQKTQRKVRVNDIRLMPLEPEIEDAELWEDEEELSKHLRYAH